MRLPSLVTWCEERALRREVVEPTEPRRDRREVVRLVEPGCVVPRAPMERVWAPRFATKLRTEDGRPVAITFDDDLNPARRANPVKHAPHQTPHV